MYRLEVGLEHLFTGVRFVSPSGSPLIFNRSSASICEVLSRKSFYAIWVVILDNGTRDELQLNAHQSDAVIPEPWERANIRALIESNFDGRVTNRLTRSPESDIERAVR